MPKRDGPVSEGDDPVRTYLCCWKDLIQGKACCFYNFIFAPCTLCLWATAIYCCGCVWVYIHRGLYKVCCFFCYTFQCCWFYNDKAFPPNDDSLGKLGGDTANDQSGKMNKEVVWLRANKLTAGGSMQLFGETVDSNDICQGALGNCWLLAAMACLAEHPGAINAVFRSKERNPRGKYRLRLYDGVKEKWEYMTIDDYIPCDKERYEKDDVCKPVFTQPNGNELWAILLEKAFAKFCGSYANTEGGQTIWAIRAMTGDPARWFMQNDDKTAWVRKDLVNVDDPKDKRACLFMDAGESIDNDTMFEVLLKYRSLRSIMCASGSSGADGLHKGHAYSILDVKKINTSMLAGWIGGGKTVRLVKIRNPWGCGEWKGDWGDKSKLWDEFPSIKKACAFQDADDGAFWMSWEDYVKNWSKIGVVDRTVDINTLRLHVRNDTACAPAIGCCTGCACFWCGCRGPKHLLCPHRSSSKTVQVKKGCCRW